MSRQLPPYPSLEHLKKEAKDLLPEFQRHTPDRRLADARHAIARIRAPRSRSSSMATP